IIVPNKEEILASKGLSTELSKEKITGLLSEELRKWTTDCSFQIGPILVIDEPFTWFDDCNHEDSEEPSCGTL
ncbi:hypothetical protein Tco_1025912, partial [Tanacetum coccineum]